MPPTKHARLSFSGAERRWNCTGSLLEEPQLPDFTSPFAEEGNRFHDFVEQVIQELLDPPHNTHSHPRTHIERVTESIGCTDIDMRYYVVEAVLWLQSIQAAFMKDAEVVGHCIEKRVFRAEDSYGTADYILYKVSTKGKVVVLLNDWKYGAGVEVDAKENPQLINYALAAEQTLFKEMAIPKEVDEFFITVYQPRTPGHPVSPWKLDDEKEIAYWKKYTTARDEEARKVISGETPPLYHVGPWCRFCKAARHLTCKEYVNVNREENLALLKEQDAQLPEPSSIPLDTLISIFEKRKQIKQFMEHVESYLHLKLENGEEVPGYKLVEGQSRRKWLEDPYYIATKLTKLGIEDPWQKKIIPIGAVEKTIGKGQLDGLTEKNAGKTQIVPLADKRPAIDRTSNIELLASADKKGKGK